MCKAKLHLLLVYPDFITGPAAKISSGGYYSEGLASIAAVVKAGGHKVSLLHLDRELDEQEYKAELERLGDFDLIGFSCRTTLFHYVKKLVAWTREVKKNAFLFAGGYHAILAPDDFLTVAGLDAVCVGEGEYPTLELLEKMAAGENYYRTKSFYFKKGREIVKNPVRPLIEDLDELPLPDINLFDYKNLSSTKTDTALIMLSRGCIYACTYCGNSQFRNIYPNKAKYARFRSPEKSIQLIRQVLTEYPTIRFISFRDAIFNMFPDWFDEFITLYTKEIKLPFTCNLRFDIVTEDTVRRMKEAGCYTIDIGLESGNREIREKYLHRFTSEEQMIKCSQWFQKYKITVLTYNILGLPYEDLHKALETVKLNARLKGDKMIPNIFYPYPGTKLREIAVEAGFLREITPKTRVYIRQPHFPDHHVLFAVSYFVLFARLYRWCFVKETKFRKIFARVLDYIFTGPLTPRRTLVFLGSLKEGIVTRLKHALINHLPGVLIYLRKKRHRIETVS
ncbi:MAG TPA: B12-binding domain-containing radical SAM protein [Firmicutes bacterium]|nr:B12-binding domain-containing radical SAM protein [Bacillota bacterium]